MTKEDLDIMRAKVRAAEQLVERIENIENFVYAITETKELKGTGLEITVSNDTKTTSLVDGEDTNTGELLTTIGDTLISSLNTHKVELEKQLADL